jgi:hypothetical protein
MVAQEKFPLSDGFKRVPYLKTVKTLRAVVPGMTLGCKHFQVAPHR